MPEGQGDTGPPQDGPERIAALQAALIEPLDSRRRAEIHVELARLALREGRVDQAVRQLREALHHDPRLEAARRLLDGIGVKAAAERAPDEPPRLRGLLSRLRR